MKRKSIIGHRVAIDVITHITLTLMCVFALFPILWGFFTSFKDATNIFKYPPMWIPNPITFEHYIGVMFASNIGRYLINSLLVALLSITITIAVACHAGYAAARFEFHGKSLIMFSILATAMIPGISVIVPLYLLCVKTRIHDTYVALGLVYAAWQMPTVVWLIRGFIETIPRELEESAMIDGCSRLRAFYQIVLPLIQPGLAAAAVIIFVYVWNDFLIAITLTVSENMRLIQVGLYRYISDLGVEWGRFMAYTMIALIPIIVLFVLLQRRFIQGLTAGAMKG